jgi:TPR repeat protein
MNTRAQGLARPAQRRFLAGSCMLAGLAAALLLTQPAGAEIVRPVPPETTPVTQPAPADTQAQQPAETADHIPATEPGMPPVDAAPPTPPAPQGNFRWPGATTAPVEVSPATEEVTDPAAMLARGLDAYRGKDGRPGYEPAARWFKAAADAGDVRASMAFAWLQAMGLGIARDPAAARQRLQAASAAGIARADYLLSLLESIDKRPQSAQRAGVLRESAARRGDAVAENAMGVHYQLQGDRTTAELWYQRAVEHGSRNAGQNLANLARSDAAKERIAAATRAADGGDADALFALAQRYHRGDGVAIDYGQALRLYRAAAAKGNEPARQMLGLIQSRTGTDGQVDPAWMQQLASATVGAVGRKVEDTSGDSAVALPKNDDPLSGLAALPAADVSPPPTRRIP